MKNGVLIIQRFYYSFREGFFEYLYDINFEFKLINAITSKGKVKVSDEAKNKPFILNTFHFFLGEKHVIFPCLFLTLIKQKPRVIITEGGANSINNLPVFLYCLILRKRYIIWDLGKGFADFGNSVSRRIYMLLYIFLLKHAKYIYGYNTLSKDYFKSLRIKEDKLIILNNTIDTRKIKSIRSGYIFNPPEEFPEQLIKRHIFLIFVGALVRNKNLEEMAELMKMLGDRYYLIIVGDGTLSYKSELKKAFDKTNHKFVGYKTNELLLPYYYISSFSVLPGLGGLSINQSMAFGVPVVCKSADGAERDLITSGKNGYIYKDLNDASKFIKSQSLDDWNEMGLQAEKTLYSEHSIEKMMGKFISYL